MFILDTCGADRPPAGRVVEQFGGTDHDEIS
jgi:hypothetical protein